jgi:hypothetical protein
VHPRGHAQVSRRVGGPIFNPTAMNCRSSGCDEVLGKSSGMITSSGVSRSPDVHISKN